MTVALKANQWSDKTAGIICDENGLYLVCKEILRQKSWQLAPLSENIDQLKKSRHANMVSCFIIVDSPTLPATETLRVLFKDPRSRLTPTLVVCSSPSETDLIIYEKIFYVNPCPKPVTAINFNNTFSKMLSNWDQPALVALRKIAALPDDINLTQKIEILDRLITNPLAAPFALSALTQLLISQEMMKEAESKLLEQAKLHIKNPGMLAICAWFYLSMRMPNQSIRFLEKLKSIAPTSTLLNLDLVSSYIGAGELSRAIDALYEWGRRNPGNPNLEIYLAKLLIAEGKTESFERFGISKPIMQKTLQDWESFEIRSRTAENKPSSQKAS